MPIPGVLRAPKRFSHRAGVLALAGAIALSGAFLAGRGVRRTMIPGITITDEVAAQGEVPPAWRDYRDRLFADLEREFRIAFAIVERNTGLPCEKGVYPEEGIRVCIYTVDYGSWGGNAADGRGFALLRTPTAYLLCHEVGHALGLSHNNDTDSCMNPAPGAIEYNWRDRAMLERIYGRR